MEKEYCFQQIVQRQLDVQVQMNEWNLTSHHLQKLTRTGLKMLKEELKLWNSQKEIQM